MVTVMLLPRYMFHFYYFYVLIYHKEQRIALHQLIKVCVIVKIIYDIISFYIYETLYIIFVS